MPQQFSKVVETRLFGITTQFTDVRLPIGDSTAGTHTSFANPLKGTIFWDDCMFVLTGVSVGGNATGGSFTVTIQTDALVGPLGFTGLPIAQATLGPNSATTVVMDNLHKSKSSPLPTHLFIDQTVANAGATQAVRLQCYAIAKQYRGMLATQGSKTAERVIAGKMTTDQAFTADTTLVLGLTNTDLGLGRMRLWDSAMFWAVGNSAVSGTWDVDVIAKVGGKTTTIASTGTGGTITAEGDRKPVIHNFYGQLPNPTHLIVTEVSAGTISGLNVVGIVKSGRGSMGKR